MKVREDVEILAPLREKERELDVALAGGGARAAARLEAARREAQSLRERAKLSLAEEIEALRRARAVELETTAARSRADAILRVAALRAAAAARREAALALILERTIGGGT